jgi:DNA-directed RNA polymerase alpha subunit
MITTPDTDNSFDKYDEPRLHMECLLKAHLVEFDFSLKLLLPLEEAGIRTLGDLVKHSRRSLQKIPQIGRTSIDHLEALLHRLGLTLVTE